MRAAFGKVNTLHNHVLPWADRPLVTNNLVGGEDGINDAGISVARLIPNPWMFLEATGQVFRGDSGDDARSQTSERGDLSYVGHLRGYQDITESTQHRPRRVVLARPQRVGHRRRRRPRTVHDAAVRRRRDAPLEAAAAVDLPLVRRPHRSRSGAAAISRTGCRAASGFYVSGDYQFARRWFAGVRFDRSDRADDASLLDTGGSVIADLLAERVQPGARPVPAHQLRRSGRRPTSSCSSSSSRSARTARIRSRAVSVIMNDRRSSSSMQCVSRVMTQLDRAAVAGASLPCGARRAS